MTDKAWMPGIGGDAYAHSFPEALFSVIAAQGEETSFADVMGYSGFAFYLFANKQLCPSATSMFDFNKLLGFAIQNNGYVYERFTRFWHEMDVKDDRRTTAAEAMKKALSDGRYPICWDAIIPEWSMVTGYDSNDNSFSAVGPSTFSGKLPEDKLGERDITILDVSIVGERTGETAGERFRHAVKRAVVHSEHKEVFGDDYASGIEAWSMWADYLDSVSGREVEDTHSEHYYINNAVAARRAAALFIQKNADGNPDLMEAAEHYRKAVARLYPLMLEYDCRLDQSIACERKSMFANAVRRAGEEDAMAVESLKAWLGI